MPEGQVVDHATLAGLVDGFTGDRLKGLVETDQGWQRINRVAGHGGLEAMDPPDPLLRPRIEAILPESDTTALDALAKAFEAAHTPNT